MELNVMTLADLRDLRSRLDKLIDASGPLNRHGAAVVVRMVPGQPIALFTSWIMPEIGSDDDYGDPGPVLVEADLNASGFTAAAVATTTTSAASIDASLVQARPSDLSQDDPQEPDPAPAPAPLEVTPPASAEAPTAPVVGMICVSGPLSEEERARIRALWNEGRSVAYIANALNRRQVAVNAFLHPPGSAKKAAPAPAAKVEPSAAAVETPVTKATSPKTADAPPPAVEPKASAPVDLPHDQKVISRYLDTLKMPKGWDEELDLDVAEMAAKGMRFDQIALDLGEDVTACRDRYMSISRTIRNQFNHVTIEGQKHLLNELRRRVAAGRGAAN